MNLNTINLVLLWICHFCFIAVDVLVKRLDNGMVVVLDRLYWMIWRALEAKVLCSTVATVEWGSIIVVTAKTFPYRAGRKLVVLCSMCRHVLA